MRAQLNREFNKGFTYIGLLLFITITGIGLSVAGMSWQYQVRAEKEKQLLFVGAEFRNAINSYYASTPNAMKAYPSSLNDLLLDKRMPTIKRHLRKIYLDPITGKADWGYETKQGRIVGIYSQSKLNPLKKGGFDLVDAGLSNSRSYNEWIFTSNVANSLKSLEGVVSTKQSSTEVVNDPSLKVAPFEDQSSVSGDNKTVLEGSQTNCSLGDCLKYHPKYQR